MGVGMGRLVIGRSHAEARSMFPFTIKDATVEAKEWDVAEQRFKTVWKPSPLFKPGMTGQAFRLQAIIGVGTFTGEPAVSVFDRLLAEVERVVSGIEAETARILRERGR